MDTSETGNGPDAGQVPGTPPVPPPPPQPERPLLRRSRDDRIIFGVAGGLGRYLGVDAVVIRIAFVLLAIFGGSGVLLYLIGLIAIPEERPGEATGQGASAGLGGNAAVVIGVALVLVGTFALLRQVIPGLGSLVGPLLLILIGAFVLMAARR